jgi:hypothetical protein
MLCDLVHAGITGKQLVLQTCPVEKGVHRMLNRNGNSTARNLGVVVKSIAEVLGSRSRSWGRCGQARKPYHSHFSAKSEDRHRHDTGKEPKCNIPIPGKCKNQLDRFCNVGTL